MQKIIKIFNSVFEENTYLIIDQNNSCYIIDPGSDYKTIKNQLLNLKVKGILLTHGHFDHYLSADKLAEDFKSHIYLHYEDFPLAKGEKKLNSTFTQSGYILKRELKDCIYDLKTNDFTILHTPGHSKGSVCYYFKKEGFLISGDTLFKGDYGRVDLYGGNQKEIRESIMNLFLLPDEVIIYPGHGVKSTIKEEKRYNAINFD